MLIFRHPRADIRRTSLKCDHITWQLLLSSEPFLQSCMLQRVLEGSPHTHVLPYSVECGCVLCAASMLVFTPKMAPSNAAAYQNDVRRALCTSWLGAMQAMLT
jgi:hypothetical protein